MKRIVCSLTLGLFLAVGLSGCLSGIDSYRLQGTWEVSVTNGNTTTITHRLVISESSFDLKTLSVIPTGRKGTFEVDILASPREIDLMVTADYVGEGAFQVVQNHDPALSVYGIYELSKDTLKLRLADDGTRPVGFDDETLTFKRVGD